MQAGSALDTQLGMVIKAFEEGQLDQALQLALRLCRTHPDVAMVHNVHGVVAAEKKAFQVAVESYRRAIKIEPDNCDIHFNLGNALRDKGDLGAALTSYHAALQIRPNDPDVVFNMATVLRGLGELGGAAELFRQLVKVAPEDHTAHNNLGGVLFRLGQSDEAIDSFRHALELRSGFVEAHDNLCEALEKTNQTDELRKAVAYACTVCRPDDIRIAIRQAQLLCRDNKLEKARDALSKVAQFNPAQAQLNSAYWYLLGDVSDRLEDVKAGYAAFVEANTWAEKAASGRGLQADKFLQRLDDLQAAYKSVRRAAPPEQPTVPRDAPQLVFLIGFPRSGTTLLDTVLHSHSQISVVEEKPLVHEMVKLAQSWQADKPLNHEDFSGRQMAELRDVYMAKLKQHLPDQPTANRVIIDKLPLNIVEAGLISKVFPDARFLLVLRHPCDCVLSCFMQDFRLNNAMSNFLDLKSAAQCYDKVMSLWATYRDALDLSVHTVKYEQVVTDLEETVGQVLEFLDLDWEEAMKDCKTTALDRKRTGTPSYHQVVQPIYNRAKDRWRRYKAQMVPVLPTLLKWAEIYGYSGEQRNR